MQFFGPNEAIVIKMEVLRPLYMGNVITPISSYTPKKTSMTMEIHHFFCIGGYIWLQMVVFSIVTVFFGGSTYLRCHYHILGWNQGFKMMFCGSRCISIPFMVEHWCPPKGSCSWWTYQAKVGPCVSLQSEELSSIVIRVSIWYSKSKRTMCYWRFAPFAMVNEPFKDTHGLSCIIHLIIIILLFVAYLDTRIVSVRVFVGTRSKGSISQDGFNLDFNCAISSVA